MTSNVDRYVDHQSSVTVPGARDVGARTDPRVGVAQFRARASARARAAIREATIERKFLGLLLVLFVAKGIIISLIFPPFTGHDEVTHYAYLRYVAEDGRLPIIPDLDAWQAQYESEGTYTHDRVPAELWEYCEYATADWGAGCRGENPQPNAVYAATLPPESVIPMGWVYTANHPPLYYLFMTPVYWLTSGESPEFQQYALRFAAIPFGLLTVLFAYLTVRTLFPRDQFLAMTVPAFVAFQPQIAYEAAMLNNDILAIAFTSGVIYFIARGLKTGFQIRDCALIGLFFGLAMLSKNTAATSGLIIAFAMVAGLGWRNWQAWMAKGAISAGVAGLLIWPWYLYMWATYGNFTALDRISELQYWNYQGGDRPSILDMLADRVFVWGRWRETWGDFGWRLIRLSDDLLSVLLWITMFATVGLAVWAVRYYRNLRRDVAIPVEESTSESEADPDPLFSLQRWQAVGVVTMGVTCVLAYYAILQFGTTFSFTQARYYFPAIVPAAILFMLGLRAWFPRSWHPYVQSAVFIGLVLLNLIIYTEYVIPYWNENV